MPVGNGDHNRVEAWLERVARGAQVAVGPVNDQRVVARLAGLHGWGCLVTEPAPTNTVFDECADLVAVVDEGDPVDGLSCDDCGRGVGWLSDAGFASYALTRRGYLLFVWCEDCQPVEVPA